METDLRVAMLCAATVGTPPQKNAGWNAVNVNFTGVASYSAKNVIGKLKLALATKQTNKQTTTTKMRK